MSGGDFIGRQERALCLGRGVEDRAQVVKDMRTAERVNPVQFRAGLPRGCVPDVVAAKGQAVTPALLDLLYGVSTRGKLRPAFRVGSSVDEMAATVMAAARGERPTAPAPAPVKAGPVPGSGGKLNGKRVDVPRVPTVVPVRAEPSPGPSLNREGGGDRAGVIAAAMARIEGWAASFPSLTAAAQAAGISVSWLYNFRSSGRPVSLPAAQAILAAPMGPGKVLDSAGGGQSPLSPQPADVAGADAPADVAAHDRAVMAGPPQGGEAEAAPPPHNPETGCLAGDAALEPPQGASAPGQTGAVDVPPAAPTETVAGPASDGHATAGAAAREDAAAPKLPPEPNGTPGEAFEGNSAPMTVEQENAVLADAGWSLQQFYEQFDRCQTVLADGGKNIELMSSLLSMPVAQIGAIGRRRRGWVTPWAMHAVMSWRRYVDYTAEGDRPRTADDPIGAAISDLIARRQSAKAAWEEATAKALKASEQIEALQRAIDALKAVPA